MQMMILAVRFSYWKLVARMERWVLKVTIKLTFGDIEGDETQFVSVSILGLHNLRICLPDFFFTVLNGVPKLSLRIIRVDTRHLDCFGFGHLLLTIFGKEDIFDIHEVSLLLHPVDLGQ